MEEKNVKMITVLFTLYNVKDDDRRMAYNMYFKDVPSDLLEKALQIVTHSPETKGFLPSVDQINTALDEVATEIIKTAPDMKLVTWSSVNSEIYQALCRTSLSGLSNEANAVIEEYGGASALLKDGYEEEAYRRFVAPKLEKIFNANKSKFNRPILDKIIKGEVTTAMIAEKKKLLELDFERKQTEALARIQARKDAEVAEAKRIETDNKVNAEINFDDKDCPF